MSAPLPLLPDSRPSLTPHWLRMLFAWRGTILPILLPRVATVFLVSVVAVLAKHHLLRLHIPLSPQPFSLIGIALAVFLGFRNNASYDRYWEARKLWGGLLIHARNLLRQLRTLGTTGPSATEMRQWRQAASAVGHALRHQLRGTDASEELRQMLPASLAETVCARHDRPIALVDWLGDEVARLQRSGRIDAFGRQQLEAHLDGLSAMVGGCERIGGTRLPFSYAVIIHRTVYTFCMMLPFGLVDTIGGMTIPVSVFVAYAFMGIDEIAVQIEHPFGTDANDLPLDAISQGLSTALQRMNGARDE